MCADRRGFLDDANRELAVFGASELAKPARGRKTRRPRADDHDVELDSLARHGVRTCGRTRSGVAL
jgi:hypothetical protein